MHYPRCVLKLYYCYLATLVWTRVFTHITHMTVTPSEVFPKIKCCDMCTDAFERGHIPTNDCMFH